MLGRSAVVLHGVLLSLTIPGATRCASESAFAAHRDPPTRSGDRIRRHRRRGAPFRAMATRHSSLLVPSYGVRAGGAARSYDDPEAEVNERGEADRSRIARMLRKPTTVPALCRAICRKERECVRIVAVRSAQEPWHGRNPSAFARLNRLRVIETLYRQPGDGPGRARAAHRPLAGDGLVARRRARPRRRRRGARRRRRRARAAPGARRSACRSCRAPASRSGSTSATSTSASRCATCRARPVVDDWSPAEVDHAPIESLDLAHELVRSALERAGIDAGPRARRRHGPGGADRPAHAASSRPTASCPAGTASARRPRWRRGSASRSSSRTTPTPARSARSVFGAARGVDDLVYIRLSAGIGAGLILGGPAVPRRSRRRGRDRPRASRSERGEICRCGNRGCLETVASPVAIAVAPRRARRPAGHRRGPARARRGRRPRRPPRRRRRRRGGRPRGRDAREHPQRGARRRRRRPGGGRRGAARPAPRRRRALRRRAGGESVRSSPERWATAPRCSARRA